MTSSLAGRTVVVTGGSMGIGLACARELVSRQARVIISARGRAALEQAATELSGLSTAGSVRAIPGDMSRQDDVDRVFAAAGRVDGVVHAAGVLGAIGPVMEIDPASWFEVVRINLLGSLLVARAACRRMKADGVAGSVVLFSGGGATSPFPNFTAYACGKAAVVRLAETLAQEVGAYGIRINCVAPGFVATRIHDETMAAGGRAGADYLERTRVELERGGVSPELAARAVAFLLSDEARGITGRLLAAPWDAWEQWPNHVAEIAESDLFTLRRIVPRDRGLPWQ